jgi:DNA polymerase-2
MPRELKGWLLSVYADELDGAVVWLLGDDGKRHRLTQQFETTFYVSGDEARLKDVRTDWQREHISSKTIFLTRQDLYKGMLPVLAVQADNPVAQQKLFRRMKKNIKWVHYFDAEIPFPIRYGVAKKIFPMARCCVQVDDQDQILMIVALDSPWDTVYDLPPLRILAIEPDADPHHASPTCLHIQHEDTKINLSLSDEPELLKGLQCILDEHDPDVIFARWGDGWLFPFLIEKAREHRIDFNPGRDTRQKYLFKKESTFESYGSIYFCAQQTHLFGRWHIDPKNSTMDMGFKFSMRSAIEMARVASVDVQTAARNSPGSGFTAMQIREALKRGILIPLQKRQTERFKSALELNVADGGGLNYRPIIGVHKDVAELDFFSMYPSIMMTWNISGETVGVEGKITRYVPGSGMPIIQDVDGLVASVLKPLLEKRGRVKRAICLATFRRTKPSVGSGARCWLHRLKRHKRWVSGCWLQTWTACSCRKKRLVVPGISAN